MGLFSGIESDEPEARAGFFKRLRTPRESFVESTQAAEPRFKDQPALKARPAAETRAVNPQVSFLGRVLSGDDVEDVESTPVVVGAAAPAAVASTEPHADLSSPDREQQPSAFVPPVFERPSVESLRAALEKGLAESAVEKHETQVTPVEAKAETQPEPVIALTPEPVVVSTPEPAVASAPEPFVALTPEPVVAQQKRNEPPAASAVPVESAQFATEEDRMFAERADALTSDPGRPVLVSAESLPEYKRILTGTDDDAALHVSVTARKEFVAVELQPGVAIVVSTARFAERAQYAAFIKDLSSNDVQVKEEMIASEAVIAAVYAGKLLGSVRGARESSRAIGNFRDIVEAAHAYGTSDIHFEPREYHSDVEIRFRVNGDLYTYERLPKAIVRRALFAAYSDLVQRNTNSGNSFQPTAPQSAMIPLLVKTDTVNLRWQSSPSVGGYDVVLRLLDGNFKNYKVRAASEMGLEASQLALIETLNYVSGGITALTGETGSGKTTLLRALSYALPDRDVKKQYAVSEPSEYPLPWLSEYSIIRRPDETDAEANRKYAEVIRTLMREDPDDITISEVRDSVVMGLVSELALTGHPVRFSLHAGDIMAAFMRMAGGRLQLPIDELAAEGFVNAVGNQKLIPTLCDRCKLPADDVMSQADLETLRRKFGLDSSTMACRNESGCEHCRIKGLFTRAGKVAGGTVGQSLAAEFYRPTPEFLDRIGERDWSGARAVWRGERRAAFDDPDMTGKTLYEHALYKASKGMIDPQFINRSIKGFDQYRVMPGVDGLGV